MWPSVQQPISKDKNVMAQTALNKLKIMSEVAYDIEKG
jgi:hypothetical protein